MPFYNDERLRKVRVGIDSYTNNELTLDVIGNTNIFADGGLGINTTNTEGYELYVNGDGYFTGVVTARTFFAGPTEITGGAFADDLTVTTLKVNGISTLGALVGAGVTSTFVRRNLDVQDDLFVGSDIVVQDTVGIGTSNAEGYELYVNGDGFFTGVVTARTFFAGPTEITGGAFADDLTVNTLGVNGVTTLGINVGVGTTSLFVKQNANIESELYVGSNLYVGGISTFVGLATFRDDVTIEGDLYINQVVGTGGTIAFTDTANNVLGDVNTGAVQIDGGLGVEKNTSIGQSLWVGENIGVGSTQPAARLDVVGLTELDELNVSGLSTFASDVDINASVDISGDLVVQDDLNVAGLSTFTSDLDVNASVDISSNLTVDGLSDLDELNVAGLSTFASDLDVNASVDISTNLTVDGLSDLDELNVSGVSTFTDITDNTLGNVDTGALQIDGGLGVAKNVSIGGSLYVQGQSEFIGVVTFRGGTINIGDQDTDDINVGGEFVSNLVPNDDDSYDLGSPTKEWRNLYVDGLVEIDDLNVAGLSTFASDVDVNASVDISSNLTVDGLSDLDELNVTGLSTFQSNVRLLDDDRLLFGTDEDNLQIYYNGFDSYIDANGSQGLRIINNEIRFTDLGNNQLVRISGNPEGIVQLSYREPLGASSVKFETTGIGVSISGGATVSGILTVGSASVVIDGDNNSITVGTGASIYTPLDNVLTFGTLDLERVRIDDGGNVGIGTTNAVGIADTNNTKILNTGIVTANFFFGSGAGLFDIFADAKGPDGAIQYNNATNIDGATNFFYDDTTNRVGIGTSVPSVDLEVYGNLNVTGVSTFVSNLIVDSNLGVGTDNPVGLADTNNTSIINTGIVTANFFFGSGAGLFDIFADAKGEDGAIQYNNNTNIDGASDFFYDDVNLRVGIGSTVPTVKLDVDGDTNITGIVTAQEFVGIGSQLSNITFRQLSDVDGSNLVAGSGISSTPDYLVIYDPLLDAFRFVDPKSYFGINNDFDPDPAIVDYGSY